VCLNGGHRPDQPIDPFARFESSDEQDETRLVRHRRRPGGRCTKSIHIDLTGIVKDELGLDGAKRNNGGQTMLPIRLSDPKQWGGFAQRRKAA
jgi:hypothetical protein